MRNASTTHRVTQVAHQLFTDEVHQTLIQFMEERAPLLPLEYENERFSRFMALNVPMFQDIHNQLVDFASDKFGEKVKPSYSFISMYDDKGICPLHIDRDPCVYTIDYLIRQDDPEPWPLYVGPQISDEERQHFYDIGASHPKDKRQIAQIKKSQTFTKIEFQPNDAVLYSGTHQWHYRDRIASGTADLVFFHFVPEAFSGSLV